MKIDLVNLGVERGPFWLFTRSDEAQQKQKQEQNRNEPKLKPKLKRYWREKEAIMTKNKITDAFCRERGRKQWGGGREAGCLGQAFRPGCPFGRLKANKIEQQQQQQEQISGREIRRKKKRVDSRNWNEGWEGAAGSAAFSGADLGSFAFAVSPKRRYRIWFTWQIL